MSLNNDAMELEIVGAKDKLVQTIYTTLHYKIKLENQEYLKREYNECSLACYDNYDSLTNLEFSQKQKKLGDCIKYCKLPLNDINNYDRNVDFQSMQKQDTCSASCNGDYTGIRDEKETLVNNLLRTKPEEIKESLSENSKELKKELDYTQCLDDCYLRLLKRYKGFWLKHKNKLLERYNSKQI